MSEPVDVEAWGQTIRASILGWNGADAEQVVRVLYQLAAERDEAVADYKSLLASDVERTEHWQQRAEAAEQRAKYMTDLYDQMKARAEEAEGDLSLIKSVANNLISDERSSYDCSYGFNLDRECGNDDCHWHKLHKAATEAEGE